MRETAQVVFHYLLGSPVIYLGIAFIAGLAANKTVAHDGRAGFFLYLLIGVFGLFLSQFVILSSDCRNIWRSYPSFACSSISLLPMSALSLWPRLSISLNLCEPP